jgi:hypothetical protein
MMLQLNVTIIVTVLCFNMFDDAAVKRYHYLMLCFNMFDDAAVKRYHYRDCFVF